MITWPEASDRFRLAAAGELKPDWDAIAAADPDSRNRYGFGSDFVHKTLTDGNTAASVCGAKRCRLAIDDWRLVTCRRCLWELVGGWPCPVPLGVKP